LDKEIDVLVIDKKKGMTLTEIKAGQRVNREEMRHLVYFASRFKTNVPIIVYRGDSAKYKIGDVTIDEMPEWKLLTGTSEKSLELRQNNTVV
jgi:Holliday junction resolvase